MKLNMMQCNVLLESLLKISKLDLNTSTKMVIKINIKRLQPDYEEFESSKLELLKTYGECIGEEGSEQYSINPESEQWAKFCEEYSPLLSQEVDVNLVQLNVGYDDFLLNIVELLESANIDLQLNDNEIDILSLICK